MSVTPTAGIAPAWSAAKPSAHEPAVQPARDEAQASPRPPEPRKGPPAPEGQGKRVDIRV